jgi:hypothetical protein
MSVIWDPIDAIAHMSRKPGYWKDRAGERLQSLRSLAAQGCYGFSCEPFLPPRIAFAAIGGSWMVDPSLIRAGKWEEITRLTREALAAAATSPA